MDIVERLRRLPRDYRIAYNSEGEKDCLEAADKIVQLRTALGDLLAIIHRDGGHHTEKVGEVQSVKDAHIEWARLQQRNDQLRLGLLLADQLLDQKKDHWHERIEEAQNIIFDTLLEKK